MRARRSAEHKVNAISLPTLTPLGNLKKFFFSSLPLLFCWRSGELDGEKRRSAERSYKWPFKFPEARQNNHEF